MRLDHPALEVFCEKVIKDFSRAKKKANAKRLVKQLEAAIQHSLRTGKKGESKLPRTPGPEAPQRIVDLLAPNMLPPKPKVYTAEQMARVAQLKNTCTWCEMTRLEKVSPEDLFVTTSAHGHYVHGTALTRKAL